MIDKDIAAADSRAHELFVALDAATRRFDVAISHGDDLDEGTLSKIGADVSAISAELATLAVSVSALAVRYAMLSKVSQAGGICLVVKDLKYSLGPVDRVKPKRKAKRRGR